MRDFFLKHKTEITIGVITSIIATLLLSWIVPFFQFLSNAGNSFLKAGFDFVFYSAANITPYTAAELMLAAMCAMLISPCLLLIMHRVKKALKTSKTPNISSSQEDSTEHNASDIKPKQSQRENRVTWKKVISLVIHSILVLILIISLILYPVILCESFEQSMVIIRPYISDQQYYQLRSDWAGMKTKENYDDIDAFITQVKIENHLIDE